MGVRLHDYGAALTVAAKTHNAIVRPCGILFALVLARSEATNGASPAFHSVPPSRGLDREAFPFDAEDRGHTTAAKQSYVMVTGGIFSIFRWLPSTPTSTMHRVVARLFCFGDQFNSART